MTTVGKLGESKNGEESKGNVAATDLSALEAAVTDNPENVTAKANYAMALYKVGNLPAAWTQLNEARKLNPDHGGIQQGIQAVITRFQTKGLFTVGVPGETIKSLLGDPDQKVDLTSRQRWVYAFYGIDFKSDRIHELVDLRGATEELFRPTETVQIDLDGRGWTCGLRKKKQPISSAYYYLPGESIREWTEIVEVERIMGAAVSGNGEQLGQILIEQNKKQYKDVRNKVIEADEQSVIVAFEFQDDAGKKNHQLVRLIKGPVDVHRIAYAIKSEQLTQETQAKWLKIFQAATLKETVAKK